MRTGSHLSNEMLLTQFLLAASLVWPLSFAMSVSSSECAVVGCGVLGTSLCKQLLASPEFENLKGRFVRSINRCCEFMTSIFSLVLWVGRDFGSDRDYKDEESPRRNSC